MHKNDILAVKSIYLVTLYGGSYGTEQTQQQPVTHSLITPKAMKMLAFGDDQAAALTYMINQEPLPQEMSIFNRSRLSLFSSNESARNAATIKRNQKDFWIGQFVTVVDGTDALVNNVISATPRSYDDFHNEAAAVLNEDVGESDLNITIGVVYTGRQLKFRLDKMLGLE